LGADEPCVLMSRLKQRRAFTVFCAALLLMASIRALGIDGLGLQLQGMSGADWDTGSISVELGLQKADELSLVARASALRLPAPLHNATAARLACPRAQLAAGRWRCSNASVQIEFSDRDALLFQASVSFNPVDQTFGLSVKNQPFAGGVLNIEFASRGRGLDIDARFSGLSVVALQQLAALFGHVLPTTVSAGEVSGKLRVHDAKGRRAVTFNLQLDAAAFSDESGSNAAEGVRLRTALSAHMALHESGEDGIWYFDSNSALEAGVVYIAPLLLEVGVPQVNASASATALPDTGPITVRARGQWSPDGRVQIAELALRDADVVQLNASMELVSAPQLMVQQMSIDIPEQVIDALYTRYLKPFAGAGLGADLRVEGVASAHVDWSHSVRGEVEIVSSARIKHLDLGDAAGQFSILGLHGELFWRSGEAAKEHSTTSATTLVHDELAAADVRLATKEPSILQWQSVQLHALELGAGTLNLRLAGRDVDLLAPLQIDLLDGAVQVERLRGRAMGTAQQHLEMQLSLLPISLQRLSDRLAWLPLSGSIEGQIPKLILSGDSLRVDGDVHMELFDGKARISNMHIANPFSAVSRLHADLFVAGIDLGILSRAFSFGQIDGRLDGEVRDLILESWQPVAFDAVLVTPPGDTSRHRISQRAVDNLASLGGAQAVLSSTFLRFFEEFSYARLGLRCRLRRGICQMGGVAPAAPGYYIVEGGGLPPRVDVVGFNRHVDWNILLDRLKAVSNSAGPVIR
jgi:hypothetical protein